MASPFPVHVQEYLLQRSSTLLDKNGVNIMPLRGSPSLNKVLREIEGQRRRSFIRGLPEPKPPSSPPLLSLPLPVSPREQPRLSIKPAPQYIHAYPESEDTESEEPQPPPVPSQRLLALLQSHSPMPPRKPISRVRLPFSFTIPRKGVYRSAVTSRATSPLFPKITTKPDTKYS